MANIYLPRDLLEEFQGDAIDQTAKLAREDMERDRTPPAPPPPPEPPLQPLGPHIAPDPLPEPFQYANPPAPPIIPRPPMSGGAPAAPPPGMEAAGPQDLPQETRPFSSVPLATLTPSSFGGTPPPIDALLAQAGIRAPSPPSWDAPRPTTGGGVTPVGDLLRSAGLSDLGTAADVVGGAASATGAAVRGAAAEALPPAPPSPTGVALPPAREPATATDAIDGKWKTSFGHGAIYDGDFRTGQPHRGIDLVPHKGGIGTPVEAFYPGVVSQISHDTNGAGGNMVWIKDAQGLTHTYMHLAGARPDLEVGMPIKRGDQIGLMGESGTKGNPHLHYEVRRALNGDPDNNLIDPRPYMTGQGPTGSQPGTTSRPVTSSVETTAAMSGGGAKSNLVGDRGNWIMSEAGKAAAWLGEEGQKAVQAILLTEGGLNNARGDGGASAGPLQFFGEEGGRNGQLNNFAKAAGLTLEQARKYVEENPVEAVKWALGTLNNPGYLGAKLAEGIKNNVKGAELATYGQRHGQVSESPERAGANYNNLFGGGQPPVSGGVSPTGATTSSGAPIIGTDPYPELNRRSKELLDEGNASLARMDAERAAAELRRQQLDDQRDADFRARQADFQKTLDAQEAANRAPIVQPAAPEGPKTLWDRIGETVAGSVNTALTPIFEMLGIPAPSANAPRATPENPMGTTSSGQPMISESDQGPVKPLSPGETIMDRTRNTIADINQGNRPPLAEQGRELGRITEAAGEGITSRVGAVMPDTYEDFTGRIQTPTEEGQSMGRAGLGTAFSALGTGAKLATDVGLEVAPTTPIGRIYEGYAGDLRRDPEWQNAMNAQWDAQMRGDMDEARRQQDILEARSQYFREQGPGTDIVEAARRGFESPDREAVDTVSSLIGGLAATAAAPAGVASGLPRFAASLALDPAGAPFAAVGEGLGAAARAIPRVGQPIASRIVAEATPKAQTLFERLQEMPMLTADDAAEALGSPQLPEYLESVVAHMTNAREKLLAGELTPRDVAKAWLLTLSSMQSQAGPEARVADALQGVMGGVPESAISTIGGARNVRPEDAMGAWMLTPEGRAALDSFETGNPSPEALAAIERFRGSATFGQPMLAPNALQGQKKGGEVVARNWFADLPRVTEAINAAGRAGDPAQLDEAVQGLRNVGPNKTAFVKQLLGMGNGVTVDSNEINWWLTGIPDARNIADKEMAKTLKEVGRSGPKSGIPGYLQDALSERFSELREKGYGKDIPEDAFNSVMHHWLWDTIKQARTPHESMYEAMNNALVATRGGAPGVRVPPRFGALGEAAAAGVGGGVQEAQQPGATPQSVLRAGLGSAAMSGTRGMLARGGVSSARLAAHAPEIQRRLREIDALPYSADTITEAYRVVTPQRVERVMTSSVNHAAERVGTPDAANFLTQVADEGKRLLQDSMVTVTGLGEHAMKQLGIDGRFTNKFNAGGSQEDVARLTQELVGKDRLKTPEHAWDFARREGRGQDKGILGSSELPGEGDPEAITRVYAYETAGPPALTPFKPAANIIWESDTPRTVTIHHGWGIFSPEAGIHASKTPKGVKEAFADPASVRGGRRIEGEYGPEIVDWDKAVDAIPVGGGRKVADTDLVVGHEGAADMRMATLLRSMPDWLIDEIKAGKYTNPADVAAVMLRETPPQQQPAILEGTRIARGLGVDVSKKSPWDLEGRLVNQIGATANRDRTESLVYNPQLQNIKAIYLAGTKEDLAEVLTKDGDTRLSLAQGLRQQILDQTGKDVPILFKDMKGIVGPDAQAVGSKLIDSAEVLEGPAGTKLAPGRAEIRERYMGVGKRDIGQATPRFAAELGGAATGGAAAWQTSEGEPIEQRVGKTVAATLAGGLGAAGLTRLGGTAGRAGIAGDLAEEALPRTRPFPPGRIESMASEAPPSPRIESMGAAAPGPEPARAAPTMGGGTVGVSQSPTFLRESLRRMYPGAINKAAVKEGVQNLIDASRGILGAKATVSVDTSDKTISLLDQGKGMTPQVMEDVFVKLGGSKKPEGAAGGMGTAIKAIMANAEETWVRSIGRDPETGAMTDSVMHGSGDDFLNQTMHRFYAPHGGMPDSELAGAPPEIHAVGEGPNGTGTLVWTKPMADVNWDDYTLNNWVGNFNKTTRLKDQAVDFYIDGKRLGADERIDWSGRAITINQASKPTEHLTSLSVPGADIDFYGSPATSETGYANVMLLNNGQYQADMSVQLPGNAKMPETLVADIKSTVDPKGVGYPWTADRNSLIDTVQKAVKEYVGQDLAADLIGKENTRVSDSIKGAPMIGPVKLVDDAGIGESFASERLAEIPKHKGYRKLASVINDLHDNLIAELEGRTIPTPRGEGTVGPSRMVGLGVSQKWLGLNVPPSYTPWSGTEEAKGILIEPWQIWREVEQGWPNAGRNEQIDRYVDGLVATMIHEIAHNTQLGGHEEGFAGLLTRIPQFLGSRMHQAITSEMRKTVTAMWDTVADDLPRDADTFRNAARESGLERYGVESGVARPGVDEGAVPLPDQGSPGAGQRAGGPDVPQRGAEEGNQPESLGGLLPRGLARSGAEAAAALEEEGGIPRPPRMSDALGARLGELKDEITKPRLTGVGDAIRAAQATDLGKLTRGPLQISDEELLQKASPETVEAITRMRERAGAPTTDHDIAEAMRASDLGMAMGHTSPAPGSKIPTPPRKGFSEQVMRDWREARAAPPPPPPPGTPMPGVPPTPKPGKQDFLGHYTVTDMLSGVGSAVQNVIGGVTENTARPIATLMEGRVTDAARDVLAQMSGMGVHWGSYANTMKTGKRTALDRYETIEMPGGGKNPFNWVMRNMAGTDMAIRSSARAGEQAAEVSRLMRQNPKMTQEEILAKFEKQIEKAGKESEDLAVMAEGGGVFGTMGKKLSEQKQKLLHSDKTGDVALGMAMQWLLPMTRVPGNIIGGGVKMFPGINEVAGVSSAIRKARAGDHAGARRELSRMALVSTTNMAIMDQVIKGNITGDGPTNPSERQRLEEAVDENGDPIWKPNSIKVGGRWFDHAALGRFGFNMGAIANVMDEANEYAQKPPHERDPNWQSEIAKDLVGRQIRTVGSAWYLQNTAKVLDAITKGNPGLIINELTAYEDRLIPVGGLQGEVRKLTDPIAREPTKEFPGSLIERAENRIPGLSQRLPPRLTATTGTPVEQPRDILSTLVRGTAPGRMTPNPIAVEISRLNQSGNNVPVSTEDDMFKGAKQTESQTRTIKEQTGQAIGLYVLDTMTNPAYANLTDKQKSDALSKAVNQAKEAANIDLQGKVARSPHENALMLLAQTPQFERVQGSPEDIARENWEIKQAKAKASAYKAEYGTAWERELRTDDPDALQLSRRAPINSTKLKRIKDEIDAATGGNLLEAEEKAETGGLVGVGSTVIPRPPRREVVAR